MIAIWLLHASPAFGESPAVVIPGANDRCKITVWMPEPEPCDAVPAIGLGYVLDPYALRTVGSPVQLGGALVGAEGTCQLFENLDHRPTTWSWMFSPSESLSARQD